MSRVPEEDRCRIVELSMKGYSQRQIRELVSRPLHTVNRIVVQAYRNEFRIWAAPRGHPAWCLGPRPYGPRSVQARLQQTVIEQLAWVPKGADLNSIDNVWGRMKVAPNRIPMPSATQYELWAAVLAEWQRVASDTSLVTAHYESLPSRMSAGVEVR